MSYFEILWMTSAFAGSVLAVGCANSAAMDGRVGSGLAYVVLAILLFSLGLDLVGI